MDKTVYCDQESRNNTREWLSLGGNPTPEKENFERKKKPKIFSCNYCMRKFYSSQALGGHQNAHKRERGVVRQYQSRKMVIMTSLPANASMIRSLCVLPHSIVNKSDTDGPHTEIETSWRTRTLEEEMESRWPGSFHLYEQSVQQSTTSTMLDLNLKL